MLVHRMHRGPLVVQKPLYPEGPDVCQCVIVHPPAGIVAGDRIGLDVSLGRDAMVQLTTPGDSKWYRSTGAPAVLDFIARVGEAAVLEWLPQGTIIYDGARASSTTRIELAEGATFMGSDVVSLGRRAAGERFRCGEWRQRIDIVRRDAFVWSERAVLRGGSRLLASPAGLNDASVFGTFVAVSSRIDDALLQTLRNIANTEHDVAVTSLPGIVIARYLGDSLEDAGSRFGTLWEAVRPVLIRRTAHRPRIWNT
jgi:urease accessory protein